MPVVPAWSRTIALVSFLVATYSVVVIILLNVGGVSYPLPSVESPVSRLDNPGLELLQWYLDGDEQAPSIANHYHYRLFLNRICAVNPTQKRGLGNCYNAGPLGEFYISQHSPDSFVQTENPFDPVVGRINFQTPFKFYSMAAFFATALLCTLPFSIVVSDRKAATREQLCTKMWGALFALCSAWSLTIASISLTFQLARLAKRMEYAPAVTHIWRNKTAMALTWTAMASLMICAIALVLDAYVVRCFRRDAEIKRLIEARVSAEDEDYADWDAWVARRTGVQEKPCWDRDLDGFRWR